ncbi:MAG: ABC transporter ATP-binding protein [Lachnospiraceae bacterium]|nr:ABC transporter ATP-binding protein [Lachnospiraceae bacterium]
MIQLKDIKKIYNKNHSNAFEALRGISLTIENQEIVAIVGTSGAGKSTLLHILAFIDSADEGTYILDERDVTDLPDKDKSQLRAGKIGLVMQDYALVEDFTAIENVMMPLDFDRKNKKKNREKKKLALQVLRQVDMEDFAKKRCNELSGGQKQRVAIARAIVNNPKLVIADEPTGALDSGNAKQIMEIFKKLQQDGKTVVFVTHDMNIASYADRIIEIQDGRLIE